MTGMKKTAGGARPGAGRPKGSANRRTRALSDKFIDAGQCPAEALVRIAERAEAAGETSLAVDAWKAVLPYVHAKPKAYELDPEGLVDLSKQLALAKTVSNSSDTSYGERLRRAIARIEVIK